MLRTSLWPNLHMMSFITLITFVDIMTFLVCVGATLISFSFSNEAFLGIPSDVLKNFNKDGDKIVNSWQIWRLVTPIFLHKGFNHIIMNVITQLLFGSWLEAMVGFKWTVYTYFVSG